MTDGFLTHPGIGRGGFRTGGADGGAVDIITPIDEQFNGASLSPSWKQYKDEAVDPDQWSVAGIVSGKLAQTSDAVTAEGRPAIYRDLPAWAEDNVEVIAYFTDDVPFVQVNAGPHMHTIPDGTDLGMATYLNILFGWYMTSTHSIYNDRVVYDFQNGVAAAFDGGLNQDSSVFTITMRSVGGYLNSYLNSTHVLGPVPIPAENLGHPAHGLYGSGWIQNTGYCDRLIIRPNDTPLEATTNPTLAGLEANNTAAAAGSITCTVPAGVQAGEILWAVCGGANTGTWTHTSGAGTWTALTNQSTTGRSARVFWKVADGTESGATVTFTKSGTAANLLVGMRRIANTNHISGTAQAAMLGAFSSQANASSTSVPAPAVAAGNSSGIKQSVIWWAYTPANSNLSLPATYDPAISVSSTGRLMAGIKAIAGEGGVGGAGAQTGTVASANTSIAGTCSIRPRREQPA